jgi:hypothetical protein
MDHPLLPTGCSQRAGLDSSELWSGHHFRPRFGQCTARNEAAFGGERAIKQANFRLLPVSGWGNRVKPTQTAKPRKITVCGAQRKPVFRS